MYIKSFTYDSYFNDISLHLNNNVIKLIPDIAISIYIILDTIATPKLNKVTKLKFNKPIKPQLSAPIITSRKDSLSNMFILHIIKSPFITI